MFNDSVKVQMPNKDIDVKPVEKPLSGRSSIANDYGNNTGSNFGSHIISRFINWQISPATVFPRSDESFFIGWKNLLPEPNIFTALVIWFWTALIFIRTVV